MHELFFYGLKSFCIIYLYCKESKLFHFQIKNRNTILLFQFLFERLNSNVVSPSIEDTSAAVQSFEIIFRVRNWYLRLFM